MGLKYNAVVIFILTVFLSLAYSSVFNNKDKLSMQQDFR